MENKTVKNMKLMIIEMNNQILDNTMNFRALKTLSNSYFTLLAQLFIDPKTLCNKEEMLELESQYNKLVELKSYLDTQSIPKLLSTGQYVEVNHITTTTTKLYESTAKLVNLLHEHIYPSLRIKIGVFGVNLGSALEELDKLLIEDKEEVLYRRNYPQGHSILTRSRDYFVAEYRDSYRVSRLDEIHVDSNLDLSKIDIITLSLKDKSNRKLF